MRELEPNETKTYTSFTTIFITIPLQAVALMQLAFPFVVPLLPIKQQDAPGLWPAYVTGPILAAPFFIASLAIALLAKSRKITIDRYGITSHSAFREVRLDWNKVESMRESTSHLLSFEFHTRGRIVNIPIAGIAAKEELRALVRKRIPQIPKEIKRASYQP